MAPRESRLAEMTLIGQPETNRNNLMKIIQGQIRTSKVGSACEFEFEVEDDATPDEIESMARDAAFDLIEWNYTIDGESPA